MIEAISRKWWLFLLRGLLAIGFAVIAFLHPSSALLTLVLVLGAHSFLVGILAIAASATGIAGEFGSFFSSSASAPSRRPRRRRAASRTWLMLAASYSEL